MKKALSISVNTVSVIIILAFAAYTGIWFYFAWRMQEQIDSVWSNQERYLIVINGEKPGVTGFPAPPKVVFAGSVTDANGLLYQSPEFIFRGFPLPTQALSLEAPQGLTFSGPVLKIPVHLNYFRFKIRVPADFPYRFDAETLKAWQRSGGSLPVETLEITRDTLRLKGDGYLNLDDDLQLAGTLSVQLAGLDDLLNELAANGTIQEKQVLIAQSLLNFVSKTDETTGESFVKTGITLQQGGVFLGPLRVATLPEWNWPRQN